jgi:hypothetical protein
LSHRSFHLRRDSLALELPVPLTVTVVFAIDSSAEAHFAGTEKVLTSADFDAANP